MNWRWADRVYRVFWLATALWWSWVAGRDLIFHKEIAWSESRVFMACVLVIGIYCGIRLYVLKRAAKKQEDASRGLQATRSKV